MSIFIDKIRLPAACLAFSLLVHILTMYGVRMCGTYTFGAPVNLVMVDLTEPARTPAVAVNAGGPEQHAPARGDDDTAKPERHLPVQGEAESRSAPDPDTHQAGPEPADVPAADTGESTPVTEGAEAARAPARRVDAAPLPLRSSAFLAAKYEKLTYQISMFGIPVGSAELESKNESGEVSIALRVRSTAALSSIYPVDNLVETRHIDGRFIMAKVRQQEGPLRNDVMFTINLGKKRVTWTDLIRGSSVQATVPADNVLDTLSGIYYLRNRPLEVGRTETLHIYDSETYAEVPVEILRREETRLPNLRKVDTLVVRPLQKTAGIFRRTGDIVIWMTDDDHRVPVKIVTTAPLGQVTAELVSADSKPHDHEIRKISR